jgi:hypothetical protein
MHRERFDFRFQLTAAQFQEAHRAYLRHSLLTVKNLFLVTIALLIGLVQAQLFGQANWILWVFGGAWLAVVGLCFFVYFWMPGKIYRARPSLSATQAVQVDQEGLDWKSGDKHRLIAWKEIKRASDIHPEYVYFHPHHGLPEILPKSVFRSDEELHAFDRFVQKCLHPDT